MAEDYKREQHRFEVKGVKLNCAVDNLPPDKLAIGTNVRPTKQGTLTTRPAIAAFLNPGAGVGPIHSLKSVTAWGVTRTFVGVAGYLTMDNTVVDVGYSGNPLTWAAYQPQAAVQPFLYVADSVRYNKVRVSDGHVFHVGTPPPYGPPNAEIGPPLYSVISDFETAAGWFPDSAGIAGNPTVTPRVPAGTVTAAVLFDSGSAGWACVAFTTSNTNWLTKGARIMVGAESSVISQFAPSGLLSTSTIAAIHYDSGSSGQCCVVLGKNSALLERNALVQLSGEFVRVLSVATGADNSVSFRCSTSGLHSAGEVVTLFDSARMYFTGSHAAGESVTGNAITSLITPVTADQVGTLTLGAPPLDLSQIANRPITADDWMHISLAFDAPANLTLVRILLDCGDGSFASNYFWAGITANVLQAASTGAQSSTSAQQTSVSQQTTAQQQLALYNELQTLLAAQQQLTKYGGAPQTLLNQIQQVEQQLSSLGINPGGPPPTIPSPSQLATGNAAWSEIFIPISSLLANRVGTDGSLGLATINAIQIEITCSAPVNVYADSWWIGGTYGVNCPESVSPDNPIQYCFRYRSTITGAQSTWSPLCRGGLFPERMTVIVSGPGSPDPQVDTVDIARVGASVDGTPAQLASVPGTTNWTYTDNYSDAELGDQIEQVDFQPWPIQQNPITGTCSVVGTTVFSTSVAIPSNLCAGTLVLINGSATVIRGSPISNTFQVEDNIAAATGVVFQINSPTTYGNPLPYLAGPYDNRFFAWGDEINPGRIYFCNDKDPETCNTSNFDDLTSASEPGLGVCMWNGYVLAMTGERFFAGTPSNNPANPYNWSETQTGCGLLVPWCFDVGPMIFFLSKSGIVATDLGPVFSALPESGGASSLSGADLYPFLPHEGEPGVVCNGYAPPVLSPVPRLSFCKDGWLYFDFQNASGKQSTLAFNTANPGWWFDSYAPGVTLHAQSEAPNAPGSPAGIVLVGCTDGSVQQTYAGAADSGGPIAQQVRTNSWSFGDFRASKQWGDAFVDCDASLTAGISVALYNDNWAGTLGSPALLTGARSAIRPPIDIESGDGSLNVNIALDFTWTGIGVLYGYEITALLEPYTTDQRATDWFDFGSAAYVRGFILMADTFGKAKNLGIQDGDTANIVDQSITHAGQQEIGYAFNPPFVAHTARLYPQDALPWRFWGVTKWIFDPWPELTAEYSGWLDLGKQGAKYLRGAVIPVDTNGKSITLTLVSSDGGSVTLGPFSTTAAEKTVVEWPFSVPLIGHDFQLIPSGPCRVWVAEIRWDFDEYPELIAEASAWMNGGAQGAKYLRSFVVPVDTNGANVSLAVLNSDGGTTTQGPFRTVAGVKTPVAAAFDPPIICHELQVIPNAACRVWWQEARWDFDPYPEIIPAYTPIMEMGGAGAMYVQGVVLTADTAGQKVAFQILYDGGQLGPLLPATAFNGKQSLPFTFPPFYAHDIQLVPQGNARIWVDQSKWVFVAAPELVNLWQPEPTAHGIQGYQTVREARPVLQGPPGPAIISATCEFGNISLRVNLTGVVQKVYLPVSANKGMLYGWSVVAAGGVRVFAEDFEIVTKPWGGGGPFQVVKPFGESGTQGARI